MVVLLLTYLHFLDEVLDVFDGMQKVVLYQTHVLKDGRLVDGQLSRADAVRLEHAQIDDVVDVGYPDVVVEEYMLHCPFARVNPHRFAGTVVKPPPLPVEVVVHKPPDPRPSTQMVVHVATPIVHGGIAALWRTDVELDVAGVAAVDATRARVDADGQRRREARVVAGETVLDRPQHVVGVQSVRAQDDGEVT